MSAPRRISPSLSLEQKGLRNISKESGYYRFDQLEE